MKGRFDMQGISLAATSFVSMRTILCYKHVVCGSIDATRFPCRALFQKQRRTVNVKFSSLCLHGAFIEMNDKSEI